MFIPGVDRLVFIPGVDGLVLIPGVDWLVFIPGVDGLLLIPGVDGLVLGKDLFNELSEGRGRPILCKCLLVYSLATN